MKTTLIRTNFAAWVLGVAAITGCSSFHSPSADFVKPGELCTDVSDLPDPNEPPKKNSDDVRNAVAQYGYGGRREESPERLLLQADSYFEQKRYHDSGRLYQKYLATSAASTASPELLATIHYRIGYVANKKTFYSEAKAEYAKALQLSPNNNEYLFSYAKACYDAQDYQEADQQFAALISRAPNFPQGQYYYGLTLLEGSNRANAIQPLATEVGVVQANALLADKYYKIGELQLASQQEAQMIQLAAQSAQPIPRLPHKEKILANAQNAAYAQHLTLPVADNSTPQP
ncbi:MAG: tetratricopeptide repeat protein, partial [Thermoguttaceae bacterium]